MRIRKPLLLLSAPATLLALCAAGSVTATTTQTESSAVTANTTQASAITAPAEVPGVTPFRLTYGATRTEGRIIWNHRSARFAGFIKAVSGKRRVLLVGSAAMGLPSACAARPGPRPQAPL